MSVIAWDGKTLAADRRAVNDGLCLVVTKIVRFPTGAVAAWTGEHERGLALARWFQEGADPAKWPAFQNDRKRWTRLITATPSGWILVYESLPEPQPVEDPFMAWGAGRDFALGAMAMGADARRAVGIANMFAESCGGGVDAFDLAALSAAAD